MNLLCAKDCCPLKGPFRISTLQTCSPSNTKLIVLQNSNTAGNLYNNVVNQPNTLNKDSNLDYSKFVTKVAPTPTFVLKTSNIYSHRTF